MSNTVKGFLPIPILALLTIPLAYLYLALTSHPQPNPQVAGTQDILQASTGECGVNDTSNWCQVQRDPQRTGYTPEVLGTNISVSWTHPFQPDKVYPQVQAIVYQGKVYVGTEGANGQVASVYALDAITGAQQWVFPVGSPILASVAASDNKIFFGAMDGVVYAVDATSGTQVWKTQLSQRHGFSTAPVIAEGKVMLGGRDGVFYALNTGDGSLAWSTNINSPLLQTGAYNNGRVFFGGMDKHLYALNSSDGSQAWDSGELYGMTFKDYWPVVHQGVVMVRPMGVGGIWPSSPFDWFNPTQEWINTTGLLVAAGNLTSYPEAMAVQDARMDQYANNPSSFNKNLHIFDENSGVEPFAVPHLAYSQTMNGAPAPPCVDRDGHIVIPTLFIRSGWGRVNLSAQRIVDILYDNTDNRGGPMDPGDYPAGTGNSDENLAVTCTGNLIIAMHFMEGNANYTGIFDLDNRKWKNIPIGYKNKQMYSNTQGGGTNPNSVVRIGNSTLLYHISIHEIIARIAQ